MDEIRPKIEELKKELDEIRGLLRIEEKRDSIAKLQLKMTEADFWQDQKQASKVIEELKSLKSDVDDWQTPSNKLKELEELLCLGDASLDKDISKELKRLEEEVKKLRLKILFKGKFDSSNAILEINSGAGGTEACDWAQMLFRMYCRWADSQGFKAKVLDEVRGEEAGIKNITFFIEGRRAFGLLKSERGVHRLVRISPFDASRRRHTSFASVDVIPEVEKDIDLVIRPDDLKIDTFRSSGRGGQHVNVTDSAVRITHLPSGIVVGCQNERSQYQNKQTAMKVLKAKLYQIKEGEQKLALDKISGSKRKIEWGSQIRSYVLHPYSLVKDHRTNTEVGNAPGVLDGKIDEFIYAYLQSMVNSQ